MGRYLRGILAVGLGFLALSGPAFAGTVKVIVADYSIRTAAYFAEAEKAFEAANPGTDISIEVVPWDTLGQRLASDIAAGTNPDIAVAGTLWLVDFVKRDVVEPLDGFIDDQFRRRFVEPFLSAAAMDGKIYGLPIAASARALFYNKELFAKAGIAEAPKTWDELKAAAQKISAPGAEIYGYGLQGKGSEADIYYYYAMWSQGVEVLDENGKSALSSDGAAAAAKIYAELITKGATQPGVTGYAREDVEKLFKQGRIGMMMSGPALADAMSREAPDVGYGIAPIPAGPTGARGTYGVTDSIIMFKNSEAKEEAWKFLDYLFTTGMRAKFNQDEGFLPVIKEEAQLDYNVNNADRKAFIELMPSAHFTPLIARWDEVAETTVTALQKIYLGADPDAVLKATAEQINGILAK
ncbi:ABC transporter substrate-binding protein [Taklimakanibacter lacteus]|uniref:ABC transporter substrate-binding protein n=1 Tax=Taklimakanibacter lacteus TaxID=2268456 RepID=UPI000E66ACFB